MRRFFTFIVQIVVLAAVAIWLADRPGTARIEWHGTVIETSAAFLGLCVLAVAFAFYLLFRVYHFLRHGPANWRLRRRMHKMEQAQDNLTKGLIAIAAGNATEAGRLAVASRKSAGNGVASKWLQAQAAQLAGDRRAAAEIFRALASDPEAAVLGYRGLITEAKRAGNWAEADRLITELHQLKPATPWLSLMRMESAARRQQWGEAESALSHATAARLMDSANGRRTRAALRIAVSRDETAKGDKDAALKAAEQAAQQAPDWLPATINLAETLAGLGHKRAATRLIERAWKTHPHPQLALILRQQAETPLAAYKDTEHLCRANPDAPESKMALAEAALGADIWGAARRYLTEAAALRDAPQNIYKMLARLERRERGNEHAAAGWLAKAAEAPADPTWLCRVCGGSHDAWQPVCGPCGSFDTLDWQSAGQSRGAVAYLGVDNND
ncbi:MAG: heme biosynthesis HemY N-terminal domain-containing protein [Alphaproteobacteria bacterium]|nr:heme biosynthesis HemY N-terminal domain-containing protein [Alphaproteobacteria bacterium]